MSTENPLEQAIEIVGLRPLSIALDISYQAILKWKVAKRLPRTEWTGETKYAEKIEALTVGKVTKASLLSKWPEPIHDDAREAA